MPQRTMTSEEVRQVQLDTLARFADWCSSRDLHWQLAFGTLLGAVRHRGFIPWDDDIDVAMSRLDYERLCSDFSAQAPMSLAIKSRASDPRWPLPFAKIWDTRTIVSEDSHLPLRAGVGIDVFPIDAIESSGSRRRLRLRTRGALYGIRALASVQVRPQRSQFKNLALRSLGPLARLIRPWHLARALERVATVLPPKHGDVSVVVGPYSWSVATMAMKPGAMLPFEDRELPGPHNPHHVLKATYGDYLTPPEHQISHHASSAHWINHDR